MNEEQEKRVKEPEKGVLKASLRKSIVLPLALAVIGSLNVVGSIPAAAETVSYRCGQIYQSGNFQYVSCAGTAPGQHVFYFSYSVYNITTQGSALTLDEGWDNASDGYGFGRPTISATPQTWVTRYQHIPCMGGTIARANLAIYVGSLWALPEFSPYVTCR
jgi:hypothetical protein